MKPAEAREERPMDSNHQEHEQRVKHFRRAGREHQSGLTRKWWVKQRVSPLRDKLTIGYLRFVGMYSTVFDPVSLCS
jgi:hypothetical protein